MERQEPTVFFWIPIRCVGYFGIIGIVMCHWSKLHHHFWSHLDDTVYAYDLARGGWTGCVAVSKADISGDHTWWFQSFKTHLKFWLSRCEFFFTIFVCDVTATFWGNDPIWKSYCSNPPTLSERTDGSDGLRYSPHALSVPIPFQGSKA